MNHLFNTKIIGIHRLSVALSVYEIDAYSDCSDCSTSTFFRLTLFSTVTIIVLDKLKNLLLENIY